MNFMRGDDTDKQLVSVLFHEFVMCEEAFDRFALFAGMNIMGSSSSEVKLNSYNAYSNFIVRLYEFYVGCFKREHKCTNNIDHAKLDALFTAEVEKLMRNRRDAIVKGYAPSWENDISHYQVPVPPDFGTQLRRIRNNTSHADYRRAAGDGVDLMGFYQKNHKFVYLLFDTAKFTWSGKTHKSFEISHVEKFDFRVGAK